MAKWRRVSGRLLVMPHAIVICRGDVSCLSEDTAAPVVGYIDAHIDVAVDVIKRTVEGIARTRADRTDR